MKIIIVNSKQDFSSDQLQTIKNLGDVNFIETKEAFVNNKLFFSEDAKVIALDPEISRWNFPNDFIDTIPNLKAICLPTTSFSWVDGAFLKSKKILLTNVPKYSTESVAEYAICLMLNVVKKIPLIIKNDGKLDCSKHLGGEVKGKIMGIIGLGTIGHRIAELGQQIGMKVVYWSKNTRDKMFDYRELDEVLKSADFIFPTVVKNEKTHQMLNKEKIDLLKPTAFIVSITGDEIFDLNYAAKKVKDSQLAGIAFESEKHTMTKHSLSEFEGNIWVTPPIAWYTKEALIEDMRIWIETVKSICEGKPINVVN